MINHWVGAELAASPSSSRPIRFPARSCTCSTARPSPSSSTSPPSRPRASTGAPSSACRTPARARSSAPPTRRKYPDTTFGIVYTGWCYDMVQMLKAAWTAVDPSDAKAVVAHLKANPYDGTHRPHRLQGTSRRRCTRTTPTRPRPGRHAPLLPGAGRQARDRRARGVQGTDYVASSVGLIELRDLIDTTPGPAQRVLLRRRQPAARWPSDPRRHLPVRPARRGPRPRRAERRRQDEPVRGPVAAATRQQRGTVTLAGRRRHEAASRTPARASGSAAPTSARWCRPS